MKKLILLLASICLFLSPLKAQKIYSVDQEYKADIKVYVVDQEYKADLLVYKVDQSYKAKGNTYHKKFIVIR